MKTEVDHFIGRRVVSVQAKGKSDKKWSLTLEGNIVIHNSSKKVNPPMNTVVGCVLLSADKTKGDVAIVFGYAGAMGVTVVDTVTLTKKNYKISYPGGGTDSEEDEPTAALPPDPSPERVVQSAVKPEEGIVSE